MFTLTLVTPEKKIVTTQEISRVVVPAFKGELDILPGHTPLMTTLSTGVLRYKLANAPSENIVAISWGYLQVHATGVNILAETAERPDEIDVARAEKALQSANARLSSSNPESEVLLKMMRKSARAKIRQEVAAFSPNTKSKTEH